MRRRDCIGLLCGASATWPFTARAQQLQRPRRIGALVSTAADDSVGLRRIEAFVESLQRLGWIEGRNLLIERRWTGGRPDVSRRYAAELVALAPDVILATGSLTLAPLLEATRSIPIVFVHVPDPVGAGFVESLARPGGNATGFSQFEYSLGVKWLELLKQIAPRLRRIAVLRDPGITAGIGMWGAIQTGASAFGLEASPIDVRAARSIEQAVSAFARQTNGALIVTGSPGALLHRELIIRLAARHRLPAIYFERLFVVDGGLMSYGPDLVDQFRRAAGYVDRILKGERPADLPVQAPTKYEMAVNLKTAKTLAVAVPEAILVAADEVIE
jgi:putative ABC transport system substrate-binding protein